MKQKEKGIAMHNLRKCTRVRSNGGVLSMKMQVCMCEKEKVGEQDGEKM